MDAMDHVLEVVGRFGPFQRIRPQSEERIVLRFAPRRISLAAAQIRRVRGPAAAALVRIVAEDADTNVVDAAPPVQFEGLVAL